MVSIVPQTWQERFDMYMKCTKKELASMLAENAKYTNPEGCAELQKNNPDPTMESVSFSASTMD